MQKEDKVQKEEEKKEAPKEEEVKKEVPKFEPVYTVEEEAEMKTKAEAESLQFDHQGVVVLFIDYFLD